MTPRAVLRIGGCIACLAVGGPVRAAEQPAATPVLLKVKPAVVIIVTEVSGEVHLGCPNRSPQRVTPAPSQAHGTGYVVTPDGYILTNGHVVQPYYEKDDREVREAFLHQAIEQACLESGLSDERKKAAVERLVPRVAPTASVELKKTLAVVLPNRDKFVAEVKAYSPALSERPGKRVSGGGGGATESGKDVAVLKIDARNLPTIPLGDSDRVQVGQPIRILGFPGVVMYHDLLDRRSAVEASVTTGHVSSLKLDARGGQVIQTDAAASWGNSGGPAINEQGEVVGMLTFISLTSDETQAIQGFNFLVPVNTVKEFARAAGVALDKTSPFNIVWHEAVDRYGRGDWAGAQSRLDAANRLVPNLPDVQRLQTDAQLRLLQASPWPSPLLFGGVAVAALAVAGGAWVMLRRRGRPVPAPATPAVPEPGTTAPPAAPSPLRLPAAELARALTQRQDLVIVDLRTPASYTASSVQANGALRASPEEIVQVCAALARTQGIILYCDSPGEATSARAARLLMDQGYTRVAVLAGGFAAWEGASLPIERTPHARIGVTSVPQTALPVEGPGSGPSLNAQIPVDLQVGVKGAGPYFNARATTLRMAGLRLATTEPLPVGQKLRLTIFLKGEPLEVTGQVIGADSHTLAEQPHGVEVAFDPLNEEAATILEGFILARWSRGPAV
ncbi:MAG: trypsin-like peptidase domain-containing protein [candidate division NC10 bacterium]|nr:trypsin-like peptidase domain-containing protein [candidate division NC10 bacterium]